MNIVHFCLTPMAGAPIRLVQALQKYSKHNVRLIDLNRWGIYDHDVIFSENPVEAIYLAENADIIHIHNYLDLDSKEFSPINFSKLYKKGTLFVRHFHSTPDLIARKMGVGISELLNSKIPSLVVAQFQERYYPTARVVPNIIPINQPDYRPTESGNLYGMFFCPSNVVSAWHDRWNTKGTPETIIIMAKAAKKTGKRIKWMTNAKHRDIMTEMNKTEIVVTEMVTGSYHLSGLEGLSLAKPTLAYLDQRSSHVLRIISGSERHPFINARIEDALLVLVKLLEEPALAKEIGSTGRIWLENYWADHQMINHYIKAYNDLVESPERLVRQGELAINSNAGKFYAVSLHDIIQKSRKNEFKICKILFAKIHFAILTNIKKLIRFINRKVVL